MGGYLFRGALKKGCDKPCFLIITGIYPRASHVVRERLWQALDSETSLSPFHIRGEPRGIQPDFTGTALGNESLLSFRSLRLVINQLVDKAEVWRDT